MQCLPGAECLLASRVATKSKWKRIKMLQSLQNLPMLTSSKVATFRTNLANTWLNKTLRALMKKAMKTMAKWKKWMTKTKMRKRWNNSNYINSSNTWAATSLK